MEEWEVWRQDKSSTEINHYQLKLYAKGLSGDVWQVFGYYFIKDHSITR